MIRKAVKALIIGFVFTVLSVELIVNNLSSYAVFYAKHTPHREGVEPVIMEVMDSLYCIRQPDIEGISYRFKGDVLLDTRGRYFTTNGTEYRCSIGSEDYVFDRRFNLQRTYDSRGERPNPDTVKMAKVKEKIYQAIQPVVDAQPEPRINLQWIYDLINRDRFNWE